jgi:lysozyme family protein
MGVTQKAYDAYTAQNKLPRKSVNDLSFGDAKDMYHSEYFTKPKFDKIPSEKVAAVLFDYGVNSGTGTAVKALQKIVGTKADGIIGNKTLKAVDKYIANNGEDGLVDAVMTNREKLLSDLVAEDPAKYGAYADGWANRTKALRGKYLPPVVYSTGVRG